MNSTMPKSRNEPLPLDFRQEVLGELTNCIENGQSCAIIGVASVGKSNVLRFLMREDVREHYFIDRSSSIQLLYIDGNSLMKCHLSAFMN